MWGVDGVKPHMLKQQGRSSCIVGPPCTQYSIRRRIGLQFPKAWPLSLLPPAAATDRWRAELDGRALTPMANASSSTR